MFLISGITHFRVKSSKVQHKAMENKTVIRKLPLYRRKHSESKWSCGVSVHQQREFLLLKQTNTFVLYS